MKLNYFFILVCLIGTMFLSSCGDDDAEDPTPPSSGDPKDDDPDTDPETSVTLTAEDFAVTIDENPAEGAVLGTIKAEVTEGIISYAITSQEKEGALSLDAETGEVSVLNPDRFDYDAYESLSAVVLVSAEGAEDVEIDIAVTLQDLDDQVGFITTWKISEEDKTVLIPINTSYDYDYTVNWGDGTTSRNHEGDAEHTYNEAGEYLIEVTGIFPAMNMERVEDKDSKLRLILLNQWGDIEWESFASMFFMCQSIEDASEDIPNMTKVTSMQKMFAYASRYNGDLSAWDVSNITNMNAVFVVAKMFNSDISKWKVGNVVNMSSMFAYASSFNQDLSSWDISSVTNLSEMFYQAEKFNSEINNWDVSNVVNMSAMFVGSSFNQDISAWDVSSVTDMALMFTSSSFNGDISKWDVSKVRDFRWMFLKSHAFNQDISGWNVSRGENFEVMFNNAHQFNQNLGSWNIQTTKLRGMFDQAGLSVENYDATLKGWSENTNLARNANFTAFGLQYCNEAARNVLLGKGWAINGDSKSANCD